ncbi:hypothetical protein GALL_521750 [mine drainage metagenome]|uniref:Uncharacterized protein n=1 Tax=mine drainage metagenome TaxID=410659 RepID=A0A1J5P515_9ZZZZ
MSRGAVELSRAGVGRVGGGVKRQRIEVQAAVAQCLELGQSRDRGQRVRPQRRVVARDERGECARRGDRCAPGAARRPPRGRERAFGAAVRRAHGVPPALPSSASKRCNSATSAGSVKQPPTGP